MTGQVTDTEVAPVLFPVDAEALAADELDDAVLALVEDDVDEDDDDTPLVATGVVPKARW